MFSCYYNIHSSSELQKLSITNSIDHITLVHNFTYPIRKTYFNLLKPTGYVMNHQFNLQQLYALPTLYLRVLYLSENKQRLVPLTA